MRNKFPLASALALCGLLTACDDGRYLVGILGQGPNGKPGSGGTGGWGGTGGTGTGGMTGPGGAGGGVITPPPSLCARPAPPRPVRPLGISTAQVAERLARLLFAGRPDAALLARTASLQTSTQVMALARELLSDGRTAYGVAALADRWLHLDDVRTASGAAVIRDQLNSELRSSLQQETRRFIQHLFLQGDGLLRTLLTAPYSFADQHIAGLYGITAPVPAWSMVMLDPRQRSGVLTHPGLLFAHPRATSRGMWVRDALLCQPIPPPPDSLEQPDLEVPVPMKTSRQRLTEETSPPPCAGCHQLADSPGFAFEHFDPLGRWRDTENGIPVTSGGSLTSLPEGGAYMFGGAPDLGASLAGDCSVQVCAVRAFLQQGLGGFLRSEDEGSVHEVWVAFAASGFDLRELLIAVTGAEAFLAP
jgi:hypothetical protein